MDKWGLKEMRVMGAGGSRHNSWQGKRPPAEGASKLDAFLAKVPSFFPWQSGSIPAVSGEMGKEKAYLWVVTCRDQAQLGEQPEADHRQMILGQKGMILSPRGLHL